MFFYALMLLLAVPTAYAQTPPGEQYTEWIRVKCAGLPDSVEAPSVMGYEKMTGECLGSGRARLHYASSHVSTVDAVLSSNSSEPRVVGVLVYAPCQTCKSPKTVVYRLKCDKPLSYFSKQDMVQYAEKHGRRHNYTGVPSYKSAWSSFIKSVGK